MPANAAPVCEIVKGSPAMVKVPLRPLVPTLGLTEYDTVPLPLPLPPPVIWAQPTLLAAPQLHPAVALTLTLPVPPAAPKDALEAESEYVHCGGGVPEAGGCMATANGYTPTCCRVFVTKLRPHLPVRAKSCIHSSHRRSHRRH